jgi:hypothetical protein
VETVVVFFRMAAEAGAETLAEVMPTASRAAAMALKIREFMEQILLNSGQRQWCPRLPGG